jgi:F-type H+-transporting ATPase subunit b
MAMKRLLLLVSLGLLAWPALATAAQAPTVEGRVEARAEEAGEVAENTGEGGETAAVHDPIPNWLSFSYAGKNAEGGKLEEGQHKLPAPFIMALINFAVLLGLFFKFAAPGFKKMARDRHELVAKQLAESKTLRDAAAAKLAEYAHKVANLEQEIATLVSNFRSEGEAEKQRIISEAEARAARLHKDAEQQIQAEIARVRTALEREVTLTAIAAAEKILVERTTDADQRALAEAFVAKLGDQKSTPRA